MEKTAKSGDAERLARDAAITLDGTGGKALRDAERTARSGPAAMRAVAPSHDSLDRADDEGMIAKPPVTKAHK